MRRFVDRRIIVLIVNKDAIDLADKLLPRYFVWHLQKQNTNVKLSQI